MEHNPKHLKSEVFIVSIVHKCFERCFVKPWLTKQFIIFINVQNIYQVICQILSEIDILHLCIYIHIYICISTVWEPQKYVFISELYKYYLKQNPVP